MDEIIITLQEIITTTPLRNHSELDQLDYESSGHTGFASSQDLETETSNRIADVEELQDAISQEEQARIQSDNELSQSISIRALITETGNKIDLECNTTNYQLVAKLYDKNDNLLSTSRVIDLPIESMIVNARYDSANKQIILTLKNGQEIAVPIGDIISGLATETYVDEKVATETARAIAAEEELDARVDEIESKTYTSLERLGAYLFKVTFNNIPEEDGNIQTDIPSGCSAYVKDGKLYRNLDWKYDETASFWVKVKNFEGISFISGLNDGNLDNYKIGQLPYHIVDGRNNNGIRVSTHVLFNDWNYAGSGTKTVNLTTIPFHILNEVKNLNELSTKITPYLNNIRVSDEIIASEYLIQILVTDGTNTYAILPPTTQLGTYQIVDITANPKLTNFRWVNQETVVRTELQERPTGVERWNLIANENTTLEDLRFTQAYESNARLSEFIGIDHTTKDSTDAQLQVIYERARQKYLTRTRNGETWQTVHSIVYSAHDIDSLFVQENYNKNYVVSGLDELNQKIDDEITRATTEETQLETAINNEIANRQASEEVINGNIETLSEGLDAAEQSIQELDTALDQEITRATNKEQELEEAIENIEVPVQSVNTKTGAVVLDATDIKLTTNQQTVQANIIRVDEEINRVEEEADEDIANINSKIPSQASSSNQLADKAFVNSSVQTATANFRGNWDNWASVPIYDYEYPIDASGVRTPSVNDYMVVDDASGFGVQYTGTWRFKYTGTWATEGRNGWIPEYQVNETPLTQAQLAALNSGITASKVNTYDGYQDQITDEQTRAEDAEDELSTRIGQNSTAIQTETSRATAKENELASDIEELQTDVATNTADIESEVSRATTAESGLQSQITTIDGKVDDNTTDIANEVERATQAEQALDNGKVDKVTGKQLSTNDYTTTEKNKLAGIESGAEVNVQSDWTQTNSNADDYIKNKPTVDQTFSGTSANAQSGVAVKQATDTVDNKLNQLVDVKTTDTFFTYNGDTVTFKQTYKNLKSGTTESKSENIGLADSSKAGLMSPTSVQAIAQLRQEVDTLEGQSIRLVYTTKSNPTPTEIGTFVYLAGYQYQSQWDKIGVVVRATNHIWRYYMNTLAWEDIGVDTVNQFTNSIAGIIKGSTTEGQIYAEDDGTGSVNGWSALKNQLIVINQQKADKTEIPTGDSLVSSNDRNTWNGKQDAISDLSTIRSNASAGAAKVSNVQSDWNATSGLAQILNKPTLFSGNYNDLTNKPTIPSGDSLVSSSDRSNWNGKQSALSTTQLNAVNSGITSSKVSTYDGYSTSKQNAITSSNKLSASLVSGLSTVATSGSYTDLSNKPTIPTALSQLSTDSSNQRVSSSEKSTWNGKSTVSGTNDGTNWTSLTVNGTTKNIPAGGGKLYAHTITCVITTSFNTFADCHFTLISNKNTALTSSEIIELAKKQNVAIKLRRDADSTDGIGIFHLYSSYLRIWYIIYNIGRGEVYGDSAGNVNSISSITDTITEL